MDLKITEVIITYCNIYYAIYSQSKKLFENWSNSYLNFFAKLSPGESIQRTVHLKGYAHFVAGEYIFQWRYNNPIMGLERNVRELPDGRIWLGPTRSNILIMVLQNEYSINSLEIKQISADFNNLINTFKSLKNITEFGLFNGKED